MATLYQKGCVTQPCAARPSLCSLQVVYSDQPVELFVKLPAVGILDVRLLLDRAAALPQA